MSAIDELSERYTKEFVSLKSNVIIVNSILRQMDELEFIKGEMTFTKDMMKDAVPELAAMYMDSYQKLYRSFLSGNEMLSKYLTSLDKKFETSKDNKEISFDDVNIVPVIPQEK